MPVFLWIFIVLVPPTCSWAAPKALELEPQVGQTMEQLLQLPEMQGSVDGQSLEPLVQLVRGLNDGDALSLPRRGNAPGAALVFSVAMPFEVVVPYGYHPDLPSYATMPSSIRFQGWTTEAAKEGMRGLVSDLRPGVVRGIEEEVITPNVDTGGYYHYRQKRVVALVTLADGPILVSVACQDGPSSVGKRGVVVGEDQAWNYLFSEKVGLGGALGWVKSYMYEGCSVAVFLPDGPRTRVASFKWLRAGWSGINMVHPSHIVEGMQRFARDFRAILESPKLPPMEEALHLARQVQSLPEERLRHFAGFALQAMSAQLRDRDLLSAIQGGQYMDTLERRELERLVFLEIWKCRLGRSSSLASCTQPLMGALWRFGQCAQASPKLEW
jgi:hypothetical protein